MAQSIPAAKTRIILGSLNTGNLFSHSPRCPRSGCQRGGFLVRAFFLPCRWLPSCWVLNWQREGEGEGPCEHGTNPILRALCSWLNLNLMIAQRPPSSNTTTLRGRASTYEFGLGGSTIQSTAIIKNFVFFCKHRTNGSRQNNVLPKDITS